MSWTLETLDSLLTVDVRDGRPEITSLCTRAAGENRAAATPVGLPFAYMRDGAMTPFAWTYTGAEQTGEADGATTLRLRLADGAAQAEYTLCFRSRPALRGPFEIWGELANRSGARLHFSLADILTAELRFPQAVTVWRFAKEGGQAENITSRFGGFYPGSGIYTSQLAGGDELSVWTDGNQNWNAGGFIPIAYLDCGGRHGAYLALEWTYGQIWLKDRSGEGGALLARVNMGQRGLFETRIGAGETFVTPTVYLGVYDGDTDDGSNVFKRWFFACKAPVSLRENPEEPYTQMDMQISPDLYPELGVESVKWDYGWWSTAKVGNWRDLEGSWQLRSEGMKKWLEKLGCPDMASFGAWLKAHGVKNWTVYTLLHDTVDAEGNVTDAYGEFNSKTHPDWFSDLRVDKGMGRSADLGNTECVAWLKEAMRAYFTGNNIGTWRSDFEPIARSSDKDNRHFANGTDVQYWTATGFYELVDFLIANVPGFRYESCCSGGAMKDFATMRRATIINIEDTAQYLSDRAVFYDSSYAIHPAQMQEPVDSCSYCPECEKHFWPKVASDMENFTDVMKTYGIRSLILGVPMSGSWCGSKDEHSLHYDIDKYIRYGYNLYREKIRPIQRTGDLYHILPRPDGVHWDGVMYADADTDREIKGVVFLFKPSPEEDEKTIRLRGLKADTRYRIAFEDHPERVITADGKTLADEGLRIAIPGDVGSEILWLTEA